MWGGWESKGTLQFVESGNKFIASIFLYDDRDYFKPMTVRGSWVPLLQKESIVGI